MMSEYRGFHRLTFWLVLLGVLHMGLSLAMYEVSMSGWFPSLTTGDGFWKFLPDSIGDHLIAARMASLLAQGDWVSWWHSFPRNGQFHVRIVSLFYALLGHSPLSAIPFNTGTYLLVVFLIYKIGETLFDRESAFWSSVVVALWPSFLLHGTQIGKELLYVLGYLLFLFALLRLLCKTIHLHEAHWVILPALVGFGTVLAIRFYMIYFTIVIWFLGAAVVLLRSGVRRAITSGAFPVAMGILICFVGMSYLKDSYLDSFYREAKVRIAGVPNAGDHFFGDRRDPAEAQWTLTWQIIRFRKKSQVVASGQSYTTPVLEIPEGSPEIGSNIDTKVNLQNDMDILRYLPRALQIGLGAPFPSMWFNASGTVGLMGRMLAGLETALMYVAFVMAAMCFIRNWRNPGLWILGVFALGGMLLLGLVVINVGTLFRLRYVFWFAALIPAVNTCVHYYRRQMRGGHA